MSIEYPARQKYESLFPYLYQASLKCPDEPPRIRDLKITSENLSSV